MKNLIKVFSLAVVAGLTLASCEGPAGPAGKDANESCTLCHNSAGVDSVMIQYEFAKHSYGEAAFEEAGSTGCTPCHTTDAFKYVVANNTSVTFAIASGATTYSNPYAADAGHTLGEMNCGMCHSKLHTSFTDADFMPLTNTAAVPLTMWGGTTPKSINLTQDGGKSNLCVKCHQPRPFVRTFGDKNVIDYNALKDSPTTVFFDGTNPASTANVNTIRPSYRTHTHYGTASVIFAGVGAVEFGSGYTNSAHSTVASCEMCHMAPVTGRAGGHTFNVKGNFNGCNVVGCHNDAAHNGPITDKSTSHWSTERNEIKGLLATLAAKIKYNGLEVMNRNPVSAENTLVSFDVNLDGALETFTAPVNLWAGITTNNYDGYLNIYDPSTNPLGGKYNTTGTPPAGPMFRNPSAPATPSSTWNAAQIAYNNTLPVLVLTNAQFGAIINFQLALREYSLGIHNTKYVRTLLTNTIAAIP